MVKPIKIYLFALHQMHPENLSIKDFTYNLPEEKIARYPLKERDESKLLIVKDDKISEDIYKHIYKHIPEKSLLIFNNTRVVEARILFQKITGGCIELFCLEPDESYPDITSALMQRNKVAWKCLVGGAKKWKAGATLTKLIKANEEEIILAVAQIEKYNDYFLIEFSWNADNACFADILHLAGTTPLPPYLNRHAEEADKKTYQTVYAKKDGSVAAPTAGLHFTERVFGKLKEKNIQHDFVTLHVGAGTFKPVKSETMQQHEMHAEFIEVTRELIEKIAQNLSSGIIAVGTTSLRTIESLYWMGVKIKLNESISKEALYITQWEPYQLNNDSTNAKDSLELLLGWMKKNHLQKLVTKTQIIIAPGYDLKIAKALITNFHQPQSTLLLLVAAILGDEWKKVYNYALQHEYRFLSYGDGCLLWK